MPGRRGRPSLLGTMGRTAVIAGTAQATANAVNRREQQRAATQLPPQAAPPPAAAPVAPVAPAAPAAPAVGQPVDVVAALSQLAHLRDSGALTEAEFQAAKARILA